MDKSSIIWSVIIVLAAGLLLIGAGSRSSKAETWKDTSVPCLPGGHQGAGQHYHAQLSVVVDGQRQSVPAQIGINSNCMAEVHTHDRSGKIHIETPANSGHQYSIRDFFAVWGKPLKRSGYKRVITVNDSSTTPRHTIKESDRITIRYQSVESTATSSATSATSLPATSSSQ